MIHNEIGLVHVIASVLALITGTCLLLSKKGTKRHVRLGYVYVLSMVLLLGTAFSLYHLFGKWGIFHYMAILSTVTLFMGMFPVIQKPRKPLSIYYHFSWMYWSVFGLYAAFTSEMLTRLPQTPFFGMVFFSTFTIMAIGGFIFGIKKEKWKNEFSILERKTLKP
ncbi:DUF2306 domain-containing protein [Shivajiella indica]|uniref:DUF2306 domain-containing protein n=1 Tax=Shivajiella indica TaxID=872115 RepID=A0ABW5BCN6_9BACT